MESTVYCFRADQPLARIRRSSHLQIAGQERFRLRAGLERSKRKKDEAMKSARAQKRIKTKSEDLDYLADFTKLLDTSTISSITGDDGNGVTLGVSVTPSGITISNEVVNNAEVTKDSLTVAANKGVQFAAKGGREGVEYDVSIKVRTSDGETRELICPIEILQ